MRTRRNPLTAAVVLALGLALFGCTETSGDGASTSQPATVTHVSGPGGVKLTQVTLTPSAAKHLGVRTAAVADVDGAKTVPYRAVVYDGRGRTWVFTQEHPHAYVRAPVTIEHVVGESVLLADGPDIGTPVVTVGAAELLGAAQGY